MAAIVVKAFDGLKPVLSSLLLGPADATVAKNVILTGGSLIPLRGSTSLKSLTKTLPATIFRYGTSATEGEHWIEFTADTDVMRSVAVEDPYGRLYWTDGVKPKYSPSALILSTSSYPGGSYDLGVPAPASAPDVSGSAPSVAALGETRTYVVTYVTAYGEEGPPSAATTLATVDAEQPVYLTNIPAAPSGNYNIALKRIYRSSTVGASAQFQYVNEIPVAQTIYTDEAAQSALGEVLPTDTWVGPPATLKGLKMLASGTAVGFAGNTIYASEPNLPYAWPYKFPVDTQIVGLGVFRQSVVALTSGHPFLLAISDPASVIPERLELPQACVSKRSIVDTGDGTIYASPDGLVSIGSGGMSVMTEKFMTADQWKAYNPASIVAAWHENRYHALYTRADGTRGMMIWDFTGQGAVFRDSTIGNDTQVTALYVDAITDTLYMAQGGNIVRFNRGSNLTATWRTKKFRLPYPQGMAVAAVDAGAYPVTMRFYCDDALFHTRIVTSRDHFRLPDGPRALDWQIEIESAHEVTRIRMASSVEEFRAAQ